MSNTQTHTHFEGQVRSMETLSKQTSKQTYKAKQTIQVN